MNKFYTLLFGLLTLGSNAQVASCTLDPNFVSSGKNGIWPDSATNFISGTVGAPYSQNLTVKVPKDTVVNPITMCFNRVEVTSPTGITNFNLPPGLNMLGGNSVTVTGSTFKFPGNANTCAVIEGTPTTAGTYTLQFKVQPYMTPSGSCPNNPDVGAGSSSYAPPSTLTYYTIVIDPPAGINERINSSSFKLMTVPNPFNAKTNIQFSVQDQAPVKISVYNLLGSKIHEAEFRTIVGENNYELDASGWNSGIYFYSIHYKNHSETKRMVINRLP